MEKVLLVNKPVLLVNKPVLQIRTKVRGRAGARGRKMCKAEPPPAAQQVGLQEEVLGIKMSRSNHLHLNININHQCKYCS